MTKDKSKICRSFRQDFPEFVARAVPYLLFGCGMIAGMVICGSLISWGWM